MFRQLFSRFSSVRAAHAAEPAVAPEVSAVLDEFLPLCAIPHQSGHEEALSVYLENWAKKHNLPVVRDAANNVIIDKPASPGCENAPRVLMQAHIDMVCVAEKGVDYDPRRDPIVTINDGKTLKAKGTSLGADNGVGVAMALCVLRDTSLVHGPLRAILTTDEEAGMTGVAALDAALVTDAAYLLNLDEEGYDVVCTSCAGGAHMEFTRSVSWTAPRGDTALRFAVSGLQGGHSGIAIHEGRASAIREVAAMLSAAFSAGLDIEVAELTGGTASNAIPDSASMVVVLSAGEAERFRSMVDEASVLFKQAYGLIEPNAVFALDSVTMPARVLTREPALAAARFITVAPNGVRTMSHATANHTESSSSMGILRLHETELEIHLLARSAVLHHMNHFMLMGEALAALTGFTRRPCTPTPGWAENPHSRLVPLVCETFAAVTGQPMHIKPTHGGLECGWFVRKNPALDAVAIGPRMSNPHSPEENLYLDTIPGIYKTLVYVLEKLV